MKRYVYFVVKVNDSTLTKLAIEPRQIMGYMKVTEAGDGAGAFEDKESAARRKERYKKDDFSAGTSLLMHSGGVFQVMESFEEVTQILEEAEQDF